MVGARRQINQQIIKNTPLDLLQELPDDGMQHRPAPDQGLVPRIQKAHRDRSHSVLLQRFEAVLANYFGLSACPQHERDVGAINVAIQQAHFKSHAAESDSKVHRNRGLPYSALARTDSYDILNARKRLRPLRRGSMWRRRMRVRAPKLWLYAAKP